MKYFPRSEALTRNTVTISRRAWLWSIDRVEEDAARVHEAPSGKRVARG